VCVCVCVSTEIQESMTHHYLQYNQGSRNVDRSTVLTDTGEQPVQYMDVTVSELEGQ